jgi:hypothetical protein
MEILVLVVSVFGHEMLLVQILQGLEMTGLLLEQLLEELTHGSPFTA